MGCYSIYMTIVINLKALALAAIPAALTVIALVEMQLALAGL